MSSQTLDRTSGPWSPFESASETSATFGHTSETSIHPSNSSCSSGSQDALIFSSPEHRCQRSQLWPTKFPVPHFVYNTLCVVLASGQEAFNQGRTQLNFTILPDILEKLTESIFQYVAYPTSAQFSDVAEALIHKHPWSYNVCYGWQQRFKYKIGNDRCKLRGNGCPELDVNSLKKNEHMRKHPRRI